MRLRDYQQYAVNSTLELLRYHRRCVAVMPTGAGKTIFFSELSKQWPTGRCLVIAHRRELVEQAAEKIWRSTGEHAAIEQAESFSDEGSHWARARYVVASVQSLHPGRLTKERFKDISLVIVDECHHASESAASYGRVIQELELRNPELRVVGVTATPSRLDEQKLIFDRFAFKYSLQAAIADGWLVEPRPKTIVVSADFSKVERGRNDLNAEQLAAIMEEERPLQEVAGATYREAGNLQTVIFCASVGHAEGVANILNRIPGAGRAEWLSGDKKKFPTDKRREILRQFAAGEVQFLANFGVLLEGWDAPNVGMLSMARPTTSKTVYMQALGRGTRPLEGTVDGQGLDTPAARLAAIAASGKPYIKVLDFVDGAKKHGLVTCFDTSILGGRFSDALVEKTKEVVAERTARGEAEINAQAAVMEARKKLQEEAEARRKAQDEEDERIRNERAGIVAEVNYVTFDVDPFDPMSAGSGREFNGPKLPAPTEAQAALLKDFGFNPDRVTKKQASGIIAKIKQGKLKRKRKPAADSREPEMATAGGSDGGGLGGDVDDINRFLMES